MHVHATSPLRLSLFLGTNEQSGPSQTYPSLSPLARINDRRHQWRLWESLPQYCRWRQWAYRSGVPLGSAHPSSTTRTETSDRSPNRSELLHTLSTAWPICCRPSDLTPLLSPRSVMILIRSRRGVRRSLTSSPRKCRLFRAQMRQRQTSIARFGEGRVVVERWRTDRAEERSQALHGCATADALGAEDRADRTSTVRVDVPSRSMIADTSDSTKDDLNDLSTKFDRLSASHEVLVKTNKELSTAKSLTEIVGIIARSPRDLAGPSSSTLNFCLPVQTALVTPSPSNQLLSLASFPTFPQTHAATTLALDSAEPALSPDTQLPSLTSFPTYLQANLAVPQASNPPDQTHDHLQRCLDSVQEPARAISSAISAWQGHGRTGSSDIHGSHARLALELAKLPRELECKMCSGRVPWSDFDLVEAASGSLGTCVCSGQSSSRCNWRPLGAVATDAPITNAAIKTPYSSAETLEKMARLRCKRNPVKDRRVGKRMNTTRPFVTPTGSRSMYWVPST